MGTVRDEFIATEMSDRWVSVSRVRWFETIIKGNPVRWEIDRFPLTGRIQKMDGAYFAAYHTAEEQDGLLRGFFRDIEGGCGSVDEAVSAIARSYDPSKDNFVARSRYQ